MNFSKDKKLALKLLADEKKVREEIRLKDILTNYEADIKFWCSDFGEGHLFLDTRKQLIPYEADERVQELDKLALKVIEQDKSKDIDKMFLQELKQLILTKDDRIMHPKLIQRKLKQW